MQPEVWSFEVSSVLKSLAGLKALKHIYQKSLQHRFFPVNIRKFYKNTFVEGHLRTAACWKW